MERSLRWKKEKANESELMGFLFFLRSLTQDNRELNGKIGFMEGSAVICQMIFR